MQQRRGGNGPAPAPLPRRPGRCQPGHLHRWVLISARGYTVPGRFGGSALLTYTAARRFYPACAEAAPGVSPGCGRRCRGVAQLVRAPVSKTGGWGFETLHPCQFLHGTQVMVVAVDPAKFIRDVRAEVGKVT